MTAAVWRLGTGESYRSIETTFGIGKSTAHEFKLDFVDALLQHHDTFIKFPETEDKTRRCIAEFKLETDFPQTVGVLTVV